MTKHQCCANASLHLQPPYKASNASADIGAQVLATALNEWHMKVDDLLVYIRYCPWCGKRLPWPTVDADSTTDHGQLPLYTIT